LLRYWGRRFGRRKHLAPSFALQCAARRDPIARLVVVRNMVGQVETVCVVVVELALDKPYRLEGASADNGHGRTVDGLDPGYGAKNLAVEIGNGSSNARRHEDVDIGDPQRPQKGYRPSGMQA